MRKARGARNGTAIPIAEPSGSMQEPAGLRMSRRPALTASYAAGANGHVLSRDSIQTEVSERDGISSGVPQVRLARARDLQQAGRVGGRADQLRSAGQPRRGLADRQ